MMKKRMILVLTLVLISVFLIGAYGFTAGRTRLRLSHHPYIHALPSYVAEKNGWYKAAGFDTTITMFAGGPPQNEALASNAWEVGTTGSGGAIFGGIGYNLHVIGFSASDNNTDIWVRPNNPIAKRKGYVKGNPNIYGTPRQWKGSTVICPSGTSCHMILMGTLKKLGLNENDIKLVDMPVAQGFPAFKAGQGDIVALWSPFGYLAEATGWIKVSSADAINVTLPTLIVASDKAIKNRRKDVRKWLGVYMKGVDYIQKDLKRAAKLLFKLEKENGIKLSAEDSRREVETRPFANMEEQAKLFKKAPGQKYCQAEEIIYQFVDYLISQGRIEPKDKQKLIDNKFVDGSFIKRLTNTKK